MRRSATSWWLLDLPWCQLTIDWETKLAAILEDVQDACKWARDKGPELFQADPRRIAVAGNSAGGYLTLTTGYRVEPKPWALVAFWGFSDIMGDWVSKPNAYYRRQP